MAIVELIDYKGDYWKLMYPGAVSRYLYKGDAFYKAWWYVLKGPQELHGYQEIPLPIFTEWFYPRYLPWFGEGSRECPLCSSD